jgi:DNA-binding MarR family transcriptional regulator
MEIEVPDLESKYIIFATIFMLSNKLQTIGDSFFEEVSTKQWFVTLILSIMEGYTPTLSELSDAVGSSRQNVKQLVLKLEQKGYVKLIKDVDDARCLRIHALPKCKEFHMAYHQKSSDFLDRLFGSFKEEDLTITKNVLLEMRKILEGLEKDYVKE